MPKTSVAKGLGFKSSMTRPQNFSLVVSKNVQNVVQTIGDHFGSK